MTNRAPYICYGFKFDGVSYISDTNFIPADTMKLIQDKSRVFVVDCLRCKLHNRKYEKCIKEFIQ
jgi:phosphoribosyl 1,2-cyclic phosphodiesterase